MGETAEKEIVEKEIAENEMAEKESEVMGEIVEKEDPLSFLKTVPRKKFQFQRGEETNEWENMGRDYVGFQQQLRGPTGYKAVFMPTPGMVPFLPPRGTPSASTPPLPKRNEKNDAIVETQQSTCEATSTSTKQSTSSGVTRRSTRLRVKSAFKFKNTEDDPVDLAD